MGKLGGSIFNSELFPCGGVGVLASCAGASTGGSSAGASGGLSAGTAGGVGGGVGAVGSSSIDGVIDLPLGVRIKNNSVNIGNLDPTLVDALPTIRDTFREFGISELVITSGNDGIHSSRNSLHYSNRAIDLRSNMLSDRQQIALARRLSLRLGSKFRVGSEHFGLEAPAHPIFNPFRYNNHIHVQLNPKNLSPFFIRNRSTRRF